VVLDVLDRTIEQGHVALAESATGVRRCAATSRRVDLGLGVVNIVHGLLDDSHWPDRRAAAQQVLHR
jgi:hypothetical protein